MSALTSSLYRRRVLGSGKCIFEGQCPKIVYYKTVNGTIYSGNQVIKGSEYSEYRQYANIVNKVNTRSSHWTMRYASQKINSFGNAVGMPTLPRLPPRNTF